MTETHMLTLQSTEGPSACYDFASFAMTLHSPGRQDSFGTNLDFQLDFSEKGGDIIGLMANEQCVLPSSDLYRSSSYGQGGSL